MEKYKDNSRTKNIELYNTHLDTISDFLNHEVYLAFSRPTGDGSLFIKFREEDKLCEMLDLAIEVIKIEKTINTKESFFDFEWTAEKIKQDNIANGKFADFPDDVFIVGAMYSNMFSKMANAYRERLGV